MRLIYTDDGSISAYNDAYNDYYHDKKGALIESIYKHIIPAFNIINKSHIRILDICFGLGYNSFLSLVFAKKSNIKVDIYSVEIDLSLLKELHNFPYPKIISNYLEIDRIFDCINNDKIFVDSNSSLNVFRGDALYFMDTLDSGFFDIVYQDAFSPSKNQLLWNEKHFLSLYRILGDRGAVTTYSSAKKVRDIARFCGFDIFDMKFANFKNGTLCTKGIYDIKDLDSVKFSYVKL